MTAPGEMRLLRHVPASTPVHGLWAGTKLACLAVLSLCLTIRPQWPGLGAAAVVLVGGFVLAQIPRSVLPRPPRWLIVLFLLPSMLGVVAGGEPFVDLGGTVVGLGGLLTQLRFLVFTLLLLLGAALIGWTTPLGDIAPAIATLGAPLRLVRAPVDEIAVTIALSIRCLPLLGEEMRVLQAARKVRRPEAPAGLRNKIRDLHDLLVTAMVSAIRRAGELAEAMQSRGGVGSVPRGAVRIGPADVVTLLATAAAAAVILIV